jgi:hypothetical protein
MDYLDDAALEHEALVHEAAKDPVLPRLMPRAPYWECRCCGAWPCCNPFRTTPAADYSDGGGL